MGQGKITPRRGSGRGTSPSPGGKQAAKATPSSAPKNAVKKTNKKVVKQALLQVALPGALNAKEREKATSHLDRTAADSNCIILFKGVLGGKAYRALYEHTAEGAVTKVCGAPNAP